MSNIIMRFIGRHQKPFGESICTWEVLTDLPEDKVMKFCQREICSNKPVMTKEEWEEGLRLTDLEDDKGMDFETYAKGYVRLVKVSDGKWWFEKHYPNLD